MNPRNVIKTILMSPVILVVQVFDVIRGWINGQTHD